MDDLRQRFASLDAVAVPDLRAEIDRRAAALAAGPTGRVLSPRTGWRTTGGAGRSSLRRPFGLPALALLGLLLLALIATLLAGAGWWNRSTVLVPQSSQRPIAIVPGGDCPGAVRTDEDAAPEFRGWALGPGPGFFTSAQPGAITALWHEPQFAGDERGRALSVVEVDPIARTSCRLMTPIRFEGAGPIDGAAVPAAGWAPHGDAFAIFRGNVEGEFECCGPGEAVVWWPGGRAIPATVGRDFGSLVWSSRGTALAVAGYPAVRDWAEVGLHTITLHPADGGSPREVRLPCGQCAMYPERFSQDDTRLAVTWWRVNDTKTDGEQLLAVVDVATGAGVNLDVGIAGLSPVGWADDRTIVAFDGHRQLLSVPVEDPSKIRVMAQLPIDLRGEDISDYAWSPDLSKVALLQIRWVNEAQGEALWDVSVLDVRSGASREIDRGIARNSGFIWAPDNRTFAYTVEIDPVSADKGVILKVADALEGAPVEIGLGVSPISWRPVWR